MSSFAAATFWCLLKGISNTCLFKAHASSSACALQEAACVLLRRRAQEEKKLPAENRKENQLRRCSTRCGRAQKKIEGEKTIEKEKRAAPLGGDALRALAPTRAARTRVSSNSRFHCSTCVYRCTYIGVSTIYIVCRNARSTNSPCPRIRACIPRIRACTAALVYPPPSPLPAGRLVHFSDY